MTALALPDLAQAIDAAHDAAFRSAASAIEAAIECGRLLIEAKSQLPHGNGFPGFRPIRIRRAAPVTEVHAACPAC